MRIRIKPGYKVKFTHEKGLRTILGFTGEEYSERIHFSENVVNIIRITSILIHITIINESHIEGSKQPVIYSFYSKVNPGYKIIQKPHNPIYLPVYRKNISTLNARITDQTNNLLDLEEEKLFDFIKEK